MVRLIVLLLLVTSSIYSQNVKVFGIIKDATNGEVLPFANIIVDEINVGTTSDENGEYEFYLLPDTYSFEVSYVGYKTNSFQINIPDFTTELNVNLINTGILLQEVPVYSSIYANELAASSTGLKNKQISEISTLIPDVFRSIQALPGIAVNNEFSAQFNVRGGTYDENLVLVNGTQVYEPFHLKVANNASVGIFNTNLIKNVNLITGGFSAKYGDRLSSVLNIEYREGNKLKHSGKVTLSLTNADAYVEGPITDNFSYIVAARKSYLDYIISLAEIEQPIKLDFYDLHSVFTYSFSDVGKLQLKFIHAGDIFNYYPYTVDYSNPSYDRIINDEQVAVNESNIEYEDGKTIYFSNLMDLKNTLFLSNNALLKTSISYYEQIDKEYLYENDNLDLEAFGSNNYFSYSNRVYTFDNKLDINTWEAKSELLFKANPFYDINTGLSYINIEYNQSLIKKEYRTIIENMESYPDTTENIYNRNFESTNINFIAQSYKLAGYLENIIQANKNFIFNLGARVDYFDINRQVTISPRISASYKLSTVLNLKAAWGYYYQSPIYRQLAYSTPSDTNTKSQKAEHFILGIEHNLPLDVGFASSLFFKVEGYYKKYTNLISSTRFADGKIEYSRENDSEGYATGIDIHISLHLLSYYGWISYGFLIAKEDLLDNSKGDIPRYTSQKHTVSFINDFKLSANWNLSLRFAFGSGFPYTPSNKIYDEEGNRYFWVEGEKNSDYLPNYKRIDLRLSKEFKLWSLSAIVFMDVSNLLNFKNIYGYKYRYDKNGDPYIEEVALWPIVPTLGFSVLF